MILRQVHFDPGRWTFAWTSNPTDRVGPADESRKSPLKACQHRPGTPGALKPFDVLCGPPEGPQVTIATHVLPTAPACPRLGALGAERP